MAAAEASFPAAYPLWDEHESVADYAARVRLPATQTIKLGNSIELELVLIPAGKFIMGTPKPVAFDDSILKKNILIGEVLAGVFGMAFLIALTVVSLRAIRNRQRLQVSLLVLMFMTLLAGAGVVSGGRAWTSARELTRKQGEYHAALMRYSMARDSEKPAHAVTLTHPFYMGKFTVTQEQYQQVIGNNPSEFPFDKHNPVENVSWFDAQYFLSRLRDMSGKAVRLPSEAEWEYSCRAGTKTIFHSGDTDADLAHVGWYFGNNYDPTEPVGQKEANAFGLYDMHGNVAQWCEDYWVPSYDDAEAVDPQGPRMWSFSALHVLRGGSAGINIRGSAGRTGLPPTSMPKSFNHFKRVGFRVVMNVVSPSH